MKKKFNYIIFLVFLIVIPSAYSLAVSPSKTLIFFNGDSIYEELTVSVRNKNNFEVLGELYMQSDEVPLEYVDFETINITFAPGETKSFSFNLSIPNQFGEPGDHEFDFIARELLPTNRTELITIRTAVGSIFLVRVPYEGYFLKSSLSAKSVTVGEKVPFQLILENLGTYPISDIVGTLEIYDGEMNEIDQIPFTYSLKTNSYETLDLDWDSSGFSYGNYHAKAILKFNGKVETAETDFKLGEVHISITDYSDSIIAGDINKYKLKVRSDWGAKISGAVATLNVDTDFPTSFRSENFDLAPWEEKDIIIYVDAEGIKKGKYSAGLVISYEGLITEESLILNVSGFDYLLIVIGVAIFVVVFGVGYFILLRKHKKKGKDGNKS
jgi:hypothetical protein